MMMKTQPAAPTDDTRHPSDVPKYPIVDHSSHPWLEAMTNEEKIAYEQGYVRALAAMDVLDKEEYEKQQTQWENEKTKNSSTVVFSCDILR
jgi:hypothetical protein